jgi:hypothetical protein
MDCSGWSLRRSCAAVSVLGPAVGRIAADDRGAAGHVRHVGSVTAIWRKYAQQESMMSSVPGHTTGCAFLGRAPASRGQRLLCASRAQEEEEWPGLRVD